jgi:glycine/D-amino acid oxidase-like deaminating enzyme/nitrite reductase/ring-hydroxylating ferredoxin subunit
MDPKEASLSIWQAESNFPFLPTLSSHLTADVCVIGAGIAGLSVAYQLLREGKSVVLLERDTLGHGQTGLTSAHLSNALDEGFVRLISLHGEEGARLAMESHGAAIREIERIIKRHDINCEFAWVDGFLFSDGEGSGLDEELEAAHRAGFTGAEHSRGYNGEPALRFPGQAQFHPARYLAKLARSVLELGGKIFVHTEVKTVEGGKPARVTTARGFQVVAASLVVAANSPFNDRFTMQTKMASYRTYVVALPVPEEAVRPALYWDTQSPYHYVRFTRFEGRPVALIGGEDHRTGQDTEKNHFAELAHWAKKTFRFTGLPVATWSGQVLEPHDGLAYIGPNPGDEENVYIVTGDSGHGLTHGSLAGLLIRDLILRRNNSWANLYDPARLSLRSLPAFLKEALNSTTPYSDWLSPGDVNSVQDIPRGEGAVVRDGLQKIAAFKDSLGRLQLCSAACPHLNGIVRWNSAEKTWDCPCHGSRFDRSGKVINGPAQTGLAQIVDSALKGWGLISVKG